MMLECFICRKKIFTAYPDNWPYRYKSRVFCSQDCKIVHAARDLHKVDFANLGEQDMKGFYPVNYIPVREAPAEEERKEDMRGQKLLTDEQKQKAIEIGLEGGDPIKYLKGCGAVNPWGNWGYIKQQLQKNDPEKFRKLMKALGEKPAGVEKADKLPEEAQKTVVHHEEPITPEHPERATDTGNMKLEKVERNDAIDATMKAAAALAKAVKKIGKEPKGLQFKVIGIETKQGKFQYDSASDQMRWMPKNSTVVIMLQSADWKKLAEDLPEIMKAIGADGREEEDE